MPRHQIASHLAIAVIANDKLEQWAEGPHPLLS